MSDGIYSKLTGYHNRRSIRLPGYDYSQPGYYFVTICIHDRKQNLFGDVVGVEMLENEYGSIFRNELLTTGKMRPNVIIDTFVIMPNHVHGILVIRDFPAVGIVIVGAAGSVAPTKKDDKNELRQRPNGPSIGSLGAIIGQYKSVISKRINAMHQTPGKIRWQRDFYDRIGRNDNELFCIRQYISNNPMQWDKDTENPISKSPRHVAMPNP